MDTTTVTVKVAQCINLASDTKLAQTQFEGVSVNYAIAKATAAAGEVFETYQKQRLRLLHEYGQLDEETGELKTNPNGSLIFKEPRRRKELEDKTQELLDEKAGTGHPAHQAERAAHQHADAGAVPRLAAVYHRRLNRHRSPTLEFPESDTPTAFITTRRPCHTNPSSHP